MTNTEKTIRDLATKYIKYAWEKEEPLDAEVAEAYIGDFADELVTIMNNKKED